MQVVLFITGAASQKQLPAFRIGYATELLALLLLTLPAVVQAQFTYTTNNSTITITRYTGPGGEVTIPDTITGLPLTRIGDYAFWSCTSLTSVKIGTNVTIIGRQTFYNCTSLTNVTIPNSVTLIGDRAFERCASLSGITIGDSVTNIGAGAFIECPSLSTIRVNTNNQAYSSVDGVLFDKSRTTLLQYPRSKAASDYSIPGSVTSIRADAFRSCTSLTNVTIPNSLTSIGDHAFESCSNLNGITLGNSVTSIGDYAFANCIRLASLTIPGSVASIGMSAFQGCTSLYAIMVDTHNPAYCSVSGVLFDKSQTTLLKYPGYKAGSDYSIPSSVTRIGDDAFRSCTSLTNVTIPNSVTSVGRSAFYWCTRLTDLTIPDSVISIGISAFQACTSLSAITVDTDNRAYSSLDGVLFDKSQTTLLQYPGGKAGSDYSIPGSVASIGGQAFYNCTGLTNVTIPNSVTSIGDDAFWFCTRLTSVTIGGSVTSIGRQAFYNCISLTNLAIPNSVTSIGDRAFASCSSMSGITIGNSVTNISKHAFEGCKGLTGVMIASSVVRIEDNAFDLCTSLTSVTIPSSVTSIGAFAFASCTSLTNVTIGTNVTDIGEDAFAYCTSLTNVTIPDSVTSIGAEAFWECFGLTTVTIPNSVTSIGARAFYRCIGLRGVYFRGKAPNFGVDVFLGANNPTVYYLPGITGWTPEVQTTGGNFGMGMSRLRVTITGASGLVVVVQACTDLTAPVWSPVSTNTLTGGSSYFSDPAWTNYARRFYRLGSLTVGGRPVVLWNPLIQAGGPSFGVRTNEFGFNVTGTTNIPIVVEACTNLASAMWTSLQACTLTNGSVYFRDSEWTNYPARVYRIRSP